MNDEEVAVILGCLVDGEKEHLDRFVEMFNLVVEVVDVYSVDVFNAVENLKSALERFADEIRETWVRS
jgi:hypothetical protein